MPYPATIPLDYSTPPFPSLYWPIRASPGAPQYLYTIRDAWRFTLYWTLIEFCLVHSAVAAWAVLMQFHSAVMQRRILRRRAKSKAHLATVSADADDGGESTGSAVRSNAFSTATKRAHLPQPLLVSNSPVWSTSGWAWIIPVVYLFIGGIEALLSGSLVGLVVGAVYNAGYYKMSTWTPFLWGAVNCLVVILGSFRIQGGL
jgi:Putative transmembrane protein 170